MDLDSGTPLYGALNETNNALTQAAACSMRLVKMSLEVLQARNHHSDHRHQPVVASDPQARY